MVGSIPFDSLDLSGWLCRSIEAAHCNSHSATHAPIISHRDWPFSISHLHFIDNDEPMADGNNDDDDGDDDSDDTELPRSIQIIISFSHFLPTDLLTTLCQRISKCMSIQRINERNATADMHVGPITPIVS